MSLAILDIINSGVKYIIPKNIGIRIVMYGAYFLTSLLLPGVTDTSSTLGDIMTSPAAMLVLGICVASLYKRMHLFDLLIVNVYMLTVIALFYPLHEDNPISSSGFSLILIFTVLHFTELLRSGSFFKKETN